MQFIDLKTQYNLLKDEIDSNIKEVLSHGQYIMGPEVGKLENDLADFIGSNYAITCSSGTDALLMALMSLHVQKGDYVLTTPFTYIATAEAIRLLGAIPEFVDIDPNTFNIDVNKVKDKIDKNPNKYKFIMPVNIFGAPIDYNAINELKQKHNIVVIEDAAQSFGALYDDRKSGILGDIGCTSFYPAKPLGCYGDAGAIFTNDKNIANKLKSIREHGAGKDKYNNVRLGLNGRMDTIQAAILLPKLKIFKDEFKKRNIVASSYMQKISKRFKVQSVIELATSSWAQFSFLCDDESHRDKVVQKLKNNNIPTAIYYVTPLHLQEMFNDLGYSDGDFQATEDICSRILSLPMHPYLLENEINKVCSLILED